MVRRTKTKTAVEAIENVIISNMKLRTSIFISELDYMVYEMRDYLNEAICHLDEIDINQEFIVEENGKTFRNLKFGLNTIKMQYGIKTKSLF